MSGKEQLRVLRNRKIMRAKYIAVWWRRILWTHMWIDHMFAYVANWGILGRFSCFSLEGSHVWLNRVQRSGFGW